MVLPIPLLITSKTLGMFDDLPETIPQKNKKKGRAIALAAGIHVLLVATIIVVQMAMPEKLGEFQLLTTLYMAPLPRIWPLFLPRRHCL